MSKFKPKQATDVFNQDAPDTSLEAADAKLYGNVDLVPNSERIVAKPVDIMTICADIMQPRRTLRGEWDGHPDQVVQLLLAWHAVAEESIKQKINAAKILKGLGDGIDYKDAEGKPLPLPPVAKKYVDLLQLGATIHKDKLINPITISRRKDKLFNLFLIETGERRWLAHHLLNHFVSPKYGKIKATEVERDVWRQAAENNNRDNLNAIQLARQLALLLMDMYKGDKEVHFDSIETLTFDGCDRRFYAQVENGNVWKIKQGFAERVQAAMGLSSYRMVSAYRRLLRYSEDDKLNDEIWVKADSESWTERAIRTYFEPEEDENTLPMGKVTDDESMFPTGNIDDDRRLPIGNLSDDENDDTPPDSDTNQSGWASHAWVKKVGYSGPVKVIVKTASAPNLVIVTTEDGQDHEVNVSSLREYTESETNTPAGAAKPTATQAAKDWTSRAVQTVTGLVGIVQSDAFGILKLKFPDDTTATIKKEFASLVDMTEWWAAIKHHKAVQANGNNAGTAAVPAWVVGDSVYLDDSQIIGKIVKIDGDTAHVELSTGVWHYKLSRLTKADPKAASSTPTAPDEDESDDDFIPQVETPDFEPFDAANMEILNQLAEIADILDIQEAEILADLCNLDRKRLERVLAVDGVAEVTKWEEIYRQAANTVLFGVMQRIETHLASITELARKITEAK